MILATATKANRLFSTTFTTITAALLLGAQAPFSPALGKDADPYLWLEDIDGEKAMQWVEDSNKTTFAALGKDPLYQEIYADALAALNSKDKLPEVTLRGDWVYYLKKTAANPRGVYLRSKLESFKAGKPETETVLDIDALSTKEGVKWVLDSMNCLKPEYRRCLVFLSPGGGDATEMREFDAQTLTFIEDGFKLPSAKMQVDWIDEDNLFVGTDFGADSLTDSGYPRLVKHWKRGTPLESANTLLTADTAAVSTGATRYDTSSGPLDLIQVNPDYWTRQYFIHETGNNIELALPETAVVVDMFANLLVVWLLDDWEIDGDVFKQGSVVLVPPSAVRPTTAREQPNSPAAPVTLLVESTTAAIVEDIEVLDTSIVVTVLEDVKSRIYRYSPGSDVWQAERVELPGSGQLLVATSDAKSGAFMARYEGFLTPPTLYSVAPDNQADVVLQQSATFDSSDMKVEQFFTESADGTRVPYFAVMQKDTKYDGSNPTHIFSYGGFRVSLTPSYSGSYEDHNGIYGKAWLERGGVFVLANIRGGAEYGPAWHAAALLENRPRAFEDFEAIAEDLIARKITSAEKLSIEGRSNGGLLVLATMIRRPDLYGSVICGMPLADMQRYNKLLAGASWMAEYGNPDTDDWSFMKGYSPYQNVSAETGYPSVYFFTSTRDDRVHPGHARKMAARMRAQGHATEYFENTEGGHKGSATAEQTARRVALGWAHLWRNASSGN